MDNVDQVVLEVFKEVVDDNAIKIENIDLNLVVCRENGIDSLGIVNLVLGIEEKLDINLDNSLAVIRKAKTLGEIAKIIKENI